MEFFYFIRIYYRVFISANFDDLYHDKFLSESYIEKYESE
ncbi:hypothetical protein EXM36_16620 [Clostridium botulinum]|uniref:Uncharacterized protein n=1 Tax=Clostridium botulinum TaxID=1491 RepID=A0A6B3WHD3_CLOBO|nr:hypothetical protein AGE31_01370 [Clostridium botulinum]NEZ53432.1 hypothetical protein [Clostridium botulinum F str. Langeland]NFK35200.1 hypothetical protein [Clostridium botulinum H04402 065]NCI21556.1 hypothetical protein [Clostridium botulinum]NCI37119.1 hypothetical protein [Clostridium botulinum]